MNLSFTRANRFRSWSTVNAWGILAAMFATIASASVARGGEEAGRLPEGPGLAARYAGDQGIARDRDVLFADDFQSGTLAEIVKRWGSAQNPQGKALELVDDGPIGVPGQRALQVTARPGQDTGGHLYTRLARGVDLAFARFYVKFPKEAGYVHHFVHFGGYRPATPWPQGGAGERPRGDDRFTVGIEPFGENGRVPPPGIWNFYTYWHEMKISADGRYWGNALRPVQTQPVPVDRWQCVEVMIKLNRDPQARDGELALWLDGKLAAHLRPGTPRGRWTGLGFQLLQRGGEPFEGFSWRTSTELKINFFWLLHYVTPEALRRNKVQPIEQPNRVRFDHVVVATRYVGPVQPGGGARSAK